MYLITARIRKGLPGVCYIDLKMVTISNQYAYIERFSAHYSQGRHPTGRGQRETRATSCPEVLTRSRRFGGRSTNHRYTEDDDDGPAHPVLRRTPGVCARDQGTPLPGKDKTSLRTSEQESVRQFTVGSLRRRI